jgi:hypothetical protein
MLKQLLSRTVKEGIGADVGEYFLFPFYPELYTNPHLVLRFRMRGDLLHALTNWCLRTRATLYLVLLLTQT